MVTVHARRRKGAFDEPKASSATFVPELQIEDEDENENEEEPAR
jgi:hypothetical protein